MNPLSNKELDEMVDRRDDAVTESVGEMLNSGLGGIREGYLLGLVGSIATQNRLLVELIKRLPIPE